MTGIMVHSSAGKELVHAVLRLPVSPSLFLRVHRDFFFRWFFYPLNVLPILSFAALGVTCGRVHCMELCC